MGSFVPWGPLCLVLFFLLHSIICLSSGCFVEERAALMDIRSSLIRARSLKVPDSWGNGDDCCLWERVKCDNSTQLVSHLDLSSVNFMTDADDHWYLNASVFSAFHELQYLDLSYNSPCSLNLEGLVGLAKLRYLYLSDTGLEGGFPEFIGEIVSLEVLALNDNNLAGGLPGAAFRNIVNLDLHGNQFSGSLPVSLFELPRLELLDLSRNNFEGCFPVSLSSEPVPLEVLNLDSNDMSGALPTEQAFENLQNLRELYLSSNQFSGNIPAFLFSLPRIEVLDLSENYLGGHIMMNSSSNLSSSLKALRLSQNNLSGTLSFIWLGNLVKLEEIDLSGNTNLVVDINIMFLDGPLHSN